MNKRGRFASELPLHTPSAGRPLAGHGPLAILFVVNICYYTDRFVLNMLIEPIRLEFGLTDGEIGLLTGIAFAVSYALMIIPIGRLTDRSHRVRILAISVTVWSLCTALFGFAKNYMQMVVFRIGVACGEAGGIVPMQSLIGDLYRPERRAMAFAILLVGGSLGKLLAYGASGVLNDAIGWRQTFIVLGVAGLILGPVVLALLAEPRRGAMETVAVGNSAGESTREAIGSLLARRAFLLIIAGYAMASIAGYAMLTWLPTFFIRRFEMSTTDAGMLTSAVTIVPNIIGMLVGGWLSDRLFEKDVRWILRLPALGLFVAGPMLAAQVFAPDLPLTVAAGFVPAFVAGMYGPPLLSAIQTVAGSRLRGTAAALVAFSLILVGQGLGPAIVGGLSDYFASGASEQSFVSLRNSLAMVSSLYVLGGLILLSAAKFLPEGIELARNYDQR